MTEVRSGTAGGSTLVLAGSGLPLLGDGLAEDELGRLLSDLRDMCEKVNISET